MKLASESGFLCPECCCAFLSLHSCPSPARLHQQSKVQITQVLTLDTVTWVGFARREQPGFRSLMLPEASSPLGRGVCLTGNQDCQAVKRHGGALSPLLEAAQLCQASVYETKAKLQFCNHKGFSPLRIVQW